MSQITSFTTISINRRKRYLKFRNSVLALLGNKCVNCGTVERLQLHHKYYAQDSIRPKSSEPGYHSKQRNLEALNHPERFMLLCLSCHNHIEPRRTKNSSSSNNSCNKDKWSVK